MKVLLALIFITHCVLSRINAQTSGNCTDQPRLYCLFACNPQLCPQFTIGNCTNDRDYYVTPGCTNCKMCPQCEKFRDKGECCYSVYGSELRCREGLTCSSDTDACE